LSENARIWERRVLVFIITISAIRLVLLPALALTPQDAYYWQYSKHLSPGYFDHPPLHAFTAWLTTLIFGDNAFGIRFGPWLYGLGLLILVFCFARRIYNPRVGFWATVAAGVTPLFSIGSSILTPDPPLLFFWTLSLYLGYRALTDDIKPLWIVVGFTAGLAMLSKYTAVFLGIGFIPILIISERGREHLKTPWPYLAVVTAFIAFLPQFIWNAGNEWASFAYQTTRRAGEISRWRLDLFAGMLGSQIAIVSPLLFGGIVLAVFRYGWKTLFGKKDFGNLYLAGFALPIMVFFSIIALRYWVKINWLAPAYITGLLAFIGLAFADGKEPRFLKWATGVALAETVLLYIIVLVPAIPITGEAAYWEGWKELAKRVEIERAEFSEEPFIAGWGYKVPSELRFYLQGHPETHSNEILGLHGLNYTYWTDTDKLLGKNCIFVADAREPFRHPEILEKHFERVEEQDELKPKRGGKVVTTFRIWRCFGYIGP